MKNKGEVVTSLGVVMKYILTRLYTRGNVQQAVGSLSNFIVWVKGVTSCEPIVAVLSMLMYHFQRHWLSLSTEMSRLTNDLM